MQGRIQNWWNTISTSLWFIPAIFITLAIAISSLLIEVDAMLAKRESPLISWIFSGTADAARTILSVIAGSLITVISIAISLTIVALVQASAQWTPRILRQFTASRVNQVVLGAYAGTFIYALLVLRAVRSADQAIQQESFVPALSVTVSIGLAVICLGLLIFFIHHTAQSFQISGILDRVRHEFIGQLDHLYPHGLDLALPDPRTATALRAEYPQSEPTQVICSEQAGFVRSIDEAMLLEAAQAPVTWIWMRPQIGSFVARGGILAEYAGGADSDAALARVIRRACILEPERTTLQDPLFAFRQIVDIALRALSPGINDMTTAEYALWHLGDMLGRLATRPFPSSERTTADGQGRLLLSRPTWDTFVAAAFDQIRRASQQDIHVTHTLLTVLADLAQQIPAGQRREAVVRQVTALRERIRQSSWIPTDAAELQAHADAVAQAVAWASGGKQPYVEISP